jgi:hypothetical protein
MVIMMMMMVMMISASSSTRNEHDALSATTLLSKPLIDPKPLKRLGHWTPGRTPSASPKIDNASRRAPKNFDAILKERAIIRSRLRATPCMWNKSPLPASPPIFLLYNLYHFFTLSNHPSFLSLSPLLLPTLHLLSPKRKDTILQDKQRHHHQCLRHVESPAPQLSVPKS